MLAVCLFVTALALVSCAPDEPKEPLPGGGGRGADCTGATCGGWGWCPTVLPPDGVQISGGWTDEQGNPWIVGGNARSQGPGVFRADGLAWVPVEAPDGAKPSEAFAKVWGISSTDVWVASPQGAIHWDGSEWTAFELPDERMSSTAIWGAASDDVWWGAHGVWHWDGHSWESAAPDLPRLPYALAARGSSSSNVWIVGSLGLARTWNGREWKDWQTPTRNTLRDVWTNGPTDVWAVGDSGTAVRWNGREWWDEPVPGQYDLTGIAAVEDELFVLGTATASGRENVLLRWNADHFESVAVPNESYARALWADGESVWVGGMTALNRWSRSCGQL